MQLLWHIALALAGMAMILVGANGVTAGSVAVARRLGVSDFVIGLTLVALGSSAPDLAVGLTSAIEGHTQFAIGNVVGSCAFDSLLVVGVVALISPFAVDAGVRRWQLPCMLMAFVAVAVCSLDGYIDGGHAPNVITRAEGLLLIMFFGIILWQSLKKGGSDNSDSSHISDTLDMAKAIPQVPGAPEGIVASETGKKITWRAWVYILGGLGLLIWGGNVFVDGAAGIAREAHVSHTIIGLTVVALGTSLPDLATSAVAAWRGHAPMAVGNVVGSCLMDALVVLGASAQARALPLGGVGIADLAVMLSGALLLGLWVWPGKRHRVSRWEGALMCAVYAVYVVYLVVSA